MSWGGDGRPGRATTAVGWSNAIVAPTIPAGGDPAPLLAFSSPDGSPHQWTISVSVLEPDSVLFEDTASFVRLSYSVGRLQNQVDIDLRRGWAQARFTADQVKVYFGNRFASPLNVAAACVPSDGQQVGEATRTVVTPVVGGVPVTLDIPRCAQTVAVSGSPAAGAIAVEVLDGAATSYAGGTQGQGPTMPLDTTLPNGARQLRLTSVGPGTVSCVFRLAI